MRKFLFGVTCLVFLCRAESQAATITESNLPPVNTLNPLDFLRANTKSTTGASRSITLSNLLRWLGSNGVVRTDGTALFTNSTLFQATNGAGAGSTLRTLDGTNVLWNTLLPHIDYGFPRMRTLERTNAAQRLIIVGDSLFSGYLDIPMVGDFFRRYGYAGGWGSGGLPQWTHSNSVGVVELVRDVTTWPGVSWNIAAGQHVTFYSDGGTSNVLANVIGCSYVCSNTAASIKLQTNCNNAGWVDMVTLGANSGGGVGTSNSFFTNSFSSSLALRAVGVSGTVRLIAGALIDGTVRGGISYATLATGGGDISEYITPPTALVGPALRGYNPDLVLINTVDGVRNATNLWSAFYQPYIALFRQYCSNADICIISTPVQESQDADYILQDQVSFAVALTNNLHFFNTRQYMGSSSNALKWGYMLSGDPHPSGFGNQFITDKFFEWSGLYSSGNRSRGTYRFMLPDNSLSVATTNYGWATVRPDGTLGLSGSHNTIKAHTGTLYVDGKLAIGFRPDPGFANSFTPAEPFGILGPAQLYYNGPGSDFTIQLGSVILPQGNLFTSRTNFADSTFITNTFGVQMASAPAVGSVLRATNTAGLMAWGAISNTYELTLLSASGGSPANSTTYYVGGDPGYSGIPTVYNQVRVEIPKAGTIKRVSVKVNMTTTATTEVVNHYIRLNNTTDTLISGPNYSASPTEMATAVNIAVAQGDFIVLKIVTPAWVTLPTGVRYYAVVYIE